MDLFTKLRIVPRREQNLLPEQQFGEETSAVATSLGRAAKVSPRLIDFGIKDYLAGAGTSSNWLITAGLEAAGWKRPDVYGEAFKEDTKEGVEAVSASAAGRFLGTRASQSDRRGWALFNSTVAQTNRTFSTIAGMDRLGIRLGQVGSSISKRELTLPERRAYQQAYADRAIPAVRGLVASRTDEDHKKKVRDKLDSAREAARLEILRGLPAIGVPSRPQQIVPSRKPTRIFTPGGVSGSPGLLGR